MTKLVHLGRANPSQRRIEEIVLAQQVAVINTELLDGTPTCYTVGLTRHLGCDLVIPHCPSMASALVDKLEQLHPYRSLSEFNDTPERKQIFTEGRKKVYLCKVPDLKKRDGRYWEHLHERIMRGNKIVLRQLVWSDPRNILPWEEGYHWSDTEVLQPEFWRPLE